MGQLFTKVAVYLAERPFLSVASAVGSAVGYAIVFSPTISIVLMVILTLHEGGHVLAMRQRNVDYIGIAFVPFIGAAAVPKRNSLWRAKDEYYVAIMGPAVGFLVALVGFIPYAATGTPLGGLLAAVAAGVNGINLLPFPGSDGDKMLRATASTRTGGAKRMRVLHISLTVVLFVVAGITWSDPSVSLLFEQVTGGPLSKVTIFIEAGGENPLALPVG